MGYYLDCMSTRVEPEKVREKPVDRRAEPKKNPHDVIEAPRPQLAAQATAYKLSSAKGHSRVYAQGGSLISMNGSWIQSDFRWPLTYDIHHPSCPVPSLALLNGDSELASLNHCWISRLESKGGLRTRLRNDRE